MEHMTAGLFRDSKKAGEAVSELKEAGYTKDISLIARREEDEELRSHQVKQDVSDGTMGGALVGGALGALFGLLATIGTIALPGLGTLIVAGPLVAAWGLTGAGAGALTGGIVGALVDAGIPEERAKMYEDAIKEGEVLVTVTTSHSNESKIRSILEKHGAYDRQTTHASYA